MALLWSKSNLFNDMPKKPIHRNRHEIDATDLTIGRLSTRIATLLRGKHKAGYEPHIDEGDIVSVTNISKVRFSGKKLAQKEYYRYSGYPGGLKTKKMSEVFSEKPGDVLKRAVKQMLPPTRLRDGMMKRLTVK